MININCTSFHGGGGCLHQAAPRRLFGVARCIVWLWEAGQHDDPRQMPTKCALCTPRPKPKLPVFIPDHSDTITVEGREPP